MLDVLLYKSLLPVRESRREPLPVLEFATEGGRNKTKGNERQRGYRSQVTRSMWRDTITQNKNEQSMLLKNNSKFKNITQRFRGV